MSSSVDPVEVLQLMATYGEVTLVSRKVGLTPKTLVTIAARPQNWRLKFAIEAGRDIYFSNRARRILEGS